MPEAADHVIWSRDHRAWWGPNRGGYYTDLSQAGRYTLSEAARLTAGSNPRCGSTLAKGVKSDVAVYEHLAHDFALNDRPRRKGVQRRHTFIQREAPSE